jgi:type II secretory pathway pseudopilin PulG
LIELLVVISIIAVLISVLLPALAMAKEAANVAMCGANLREIAQTASTYSTDNDPTGTGSVPTQPWHLGFDCRCGQPPTYSYSYASEFVYGGFRTNLDNPDFPSSDVYWIPTECRPYNKYIAPGIGGRAPIKSYVDPSDKSAATPLLGSGGEPPKVEDRFSAWEVNGNSYAINWYWPYGVSATYHNEYWDLPCMTALGSAMLTKKVGGAASEFVLFMEGMMNAYMMDAKPPDGSLGLSALQQLGVGWHRKISIYNAGFMDGHADYKFFDTRYTSGAGWTTWPSANTGWPSCG